LCDAKDFLYFVELFHAKDKYDLLLDALKTLGGEGMFQTGKQQKKATENS
jgi:hypothetical protein